MKINNLIKPKCRLCPKECNIGRDTHKGLCKTENRIEIASYNLHFGEEPPISGQNGSGTIFFAGCNLSCIYCQNYPISQLKSAYRQISEDELADIMLNLESRGAHNINLVTPSHFVHLICKSIDTAKKRGLEIPIVYNTSSYDKEEIINFLNDYVDIYLADLKYTDSSISKQLSGIPDYFEVAAKALSVMYKTKGVLKTKNGIAQKGLIVRHLVLPNMLENTKKALNWLSKNLPGVHISIMYQYFPAYKALKSDIINRKLSYKEYVEVSDFVQNLKNLKEFEQEFSQ